MSPARPVSRLLLVAAFAALAACDDDAVPQNDAGGTPDTASSDGFQTLPDVGEDTAPGDTFVPLPDPGTPDAEQDAPADPDAADAADDADDPPCFGCNYGPCEDNDDCYSGFCIEGPDGRICTDVCSAECPAGFSCRPVGGSGGDPTFICIYDHVPLCRPCEQDGDCAHPLASGGDNRCVPHEDGSGSFCATACSDGGECPPGSACEDVALGDEVVSLCRPADGACECSSRAIEEAASTTCSISNDHGTCAGRRACSEDGLTACDAPEPMAEACNDLDDDCDGETDEGFEELGQPCDGEQDEDACEDGVWTCEATGLVCVDDEASKVESCNGQDDDCDGETDEDFKAGGEHTFTDADGTDGLVLGDPCGVGHCAGGEVVCTADGAGMVCSSALGGAVETCNGVDDDCDGETDEDFKAGGDQVYVSPEGESIPLGEPCGLGACAGGEVVCGPGGAPVCSTADLADTETCDGTDEDCDGETDEAYEAGGKFTFTDLDGADGLVLGDSCGAGACDGGSVVCDPDGPGLVCDSHAQASAEDCNAADDDCDGQTDEDLLLSDDVPALDAAGCKVAGVCGLPGATVATCDAGSWTCDYVSEHYEADETRCDNRDNDCDEELDEVPAVDDAETLAELGCATQGVCGSPGTTSATCTNGTWSCDYGHPAWEPTETRCDGFDNDCDGQTDPDGIQECQQVYADTDGDGYGDPDAVSCQCFPGTGWENNDDDCWDGSAQVSPDHTSWHTSKHGGGSFDWDCDDKVEKRWTQTVGRCQAKVSADEETIEACIAEFGDSSGWRGSAPTCGEAGDWHDAADCQPKWGVLESEVDSDEEAVFCAFGACVGACVWTDPTPKPQECR
ncbi:MAG: MopE-related protein [Myxococcota bacterium]